MEDDLNVWPDPKAMALSRAINQQFIKPPTMKLRISLTFSKDEWQSQKEEWAKLIGFAANHDDFAQHLLHLHKTCGKCAQDISCKNNYDNGGGQEIGLVDQHQMDNRLLLESQDEEPDEMIMPNIDTDSNDDEEMYVPEPPKPKKSKPGPKKKVVEAAAATSAASPSSAEKRGRGRPRRKAAEAVIAKVIAATITSEKDDEEEISEGYEPEEQEEEEEDEDVEEGDEEEVTDKDSESKIQVDLNAEPIHLSCVYCEDIYLDRETYFTHVTSAHPDNRVLRKKGEFFCLKCGNGYGLISELVEHQCSWRYSYCCVECKIFYPRKGFLSEHERIFHKRLTPCLCDICGTEFTCKKSLRQHLVVHSDVKPYECETCGKKFRRSTDLRVHEKIHKDSRDHLCQECGKKFMSNAKLKRHGLIHTKVKPYVCHICQKAFNQNSNLVVHLKSHERGTISDTGDVEGRKPNSCTKRTVKIEQVSENDEEEPYQDTLDSRV